MAACFERHRERALRASASRLERDGDRVRVRRGRRVAVGRTGHVRRVPHVVGGNVKIRLWLDELERLPEYSRSKPSGVCPFKAWRRRERTASGEVWLVGMYVPIQDTTSELYTMYFDVQLLEGPRRDGEPLRLKVQCTRGELRSHG